MRTAKIGDAFYSKNHDSYVIHLRENFEYDIYKNSQFLHPLKLQDVPIDIRSSMELELGRLICNLEADLELKKISDDDQ